MKGNLRVKRRDPWHRANVFFLLILLSTMSFYTPSVAVDPITTAHSVMAQPTSQALVLANSARAMHYPASTAMTIPTGRNSYMYGSYAQPLQYGYHPQSVPLYVQPQQQQVVYTVPNYGYGGMPMTTAQYMPSASMFVQDPYGYSSRRRHRRHRRYSYGGYPTYY
jgi:hypothetical protein